MKILILSILPFIASCSNTILVKPNAALTAPIVKPELEGNTWRNLAESYIKRGQAIDECNRNLTAIREQK